MTKLKENILNRLLSGETISGEQMAMKYKVSRAAVCKCVKDLRLDGYDISAKSGRGYSLCLGDMLSAEKIQMLAGGEWKAEVHETLTSTNDAAKKHAASGGNFVAVLAETQSAGRGRLGRGFFCKKGSGLYISALIRPKLDMTDCGKITAYAAVVAAKAVEKLCGKSVDIKWVNDLYMNSKKICGILTEGGMGFEGGSLDYAVIGIGINVTDPCFPDDVREVATDVQTESGVKIGRCELAAEILKGLAETETQIKNGGFIADYRSRLFMLGSEVVVNGSYTAKAVALDDDCSLILEREGKRIKFSAGEVTLKLK